MKKIDYQIIDALGATIYWKDLEGRYLGCNKKVETLAGLSRDEIIGKTDYSLPWKNDANNSRKEDQSFFAGNFINDLDYQILDSINANIYWKDLEGRILGCNKKLATLAGLPRDEIIGKTDYSLPWKNDADKIRKIDQLVTTECKEYKEQEIVVFPNGAQKIFFTSKSPLFNDKNELIGIIGISVELSTTKNVVLESEKTEQAQGEDLKIKHRFLQDISDEVRIPLKSLVSIIKNDKKCSIKAAALLKKS